MILEPPAHVESVHDRHHDVEQNQIRCFGLDFLQCFLTVVSLDDLVAAWEQHRFHELYVFLFIIDDEDFGLYVIHRLFF